MNSKLGKANEDATARVAKAKRGARAPETSIRQEKAGAATPGEQANVTLELEQTQRLIERLSPVYHRPACPQFSG
jgi:hypothetical protein